MSLTLPFEFMDVTFKLGSNDGFSLFPLKSQPDLHRAAVQERYRAPRKVVRAVYEDDGGGEAAKGQEGEGRRMTNEVKDVPTISMGYARSGVSTRVIGPP